MNDRISQETRIEYLDNKYDKIMNGLEDWTEYYRQNPHEFLMEYFGMRWLTVFQCFIVWACFHFDYAMLIATRGYGKTQLVSAVACARAVLYPNSKIIVASGNQGQSVSFIQKITNEFEPSSENLRKEIANSSTTKATAFVKFKNGSIIEAVTSNEGARSKRATYLIMDEFVQIKKSIVDGVLKKFKAGRRSAGFTRKSEYADTFTEPNSEIYISSACYKGDWQWEKFKSFVMGMLQDNGDFAIGMPYQVPILDGYFHKEDVLKEMGESDMDSVKWSMEMDSLFYGSSEEAFFQYDALNNLQNLTYPIYPRELYTKYQCNEIQFARKESNEKRLLICDMSSSSKSSSDNTAIMVMSLFPTSNNQYVRQVRYIETIPLANKGALRQAIRIRELYDDFECDLIVIDANGVGDPIKDLLYEELRDENKDIIYPPLAPMNNEDDFINKCRGNESYPKVVYCMKANTKINSNAYIWLKDNIQRRKIQLLIKDNIAETELMQLPNFQKLEPEVQALFMLPYKHTTLLIDEMINLTDSRNSKNEIILNNNTTRKDRFSALAYGNYVANELEKDLVDKKSEYEYVFLYD